MFGIIAAFALTGNPVWGMGVAPAVIMMIICALLRGITRYIEQYLNHNVAFHLLALFRSKAFAALRRLAPAKLAGKGKGNLIAMLTTDVELLEIFFAHTISPVAIAVTSTIIYTIVAATLSPWMALALIAAHLVIGILVPRFFATGVRNLGPAIRGAAGELDDVILDDMRAWTKSSDLVAARNVRRPSRTVPMRCGRITPNSARSTAVSPESADSWWLCSQRLRSPWLLPVPARTRRAFRL